MSPWPVTAAPTRGSEPLPPPAGPEVGGGPSAAVAAIGPDGCPVAVATGLPSSLDVIGTVVGVADVAILGDQLYALVSGGGGSHGNPDQPSGLYRVYADGSFELAADLQSWYKANPVARPAEVEPDGQWYGMVAASDGTALWVVESNGGQVLTVTPMAPSPGWQTSPRGTRSRPASRLPPTVASTSATSPRSPSSTGPPGSIVSPSTDP